jgi:SAM-dependent methyltransferase
MALDVVDLRTFYGSPLGVAVARVLSGEIGRRWGGLAGASVVGLGYALPYLTRMRQDAMRTLAFMPAEQGVVRWPPADEPCSTALVEDEELPLPSSSVDRVLMIHMLEAARRPTEVLREVWRAMESGGRLLIVVPARRGLWARAEWTPFGQGHPYSRSQLDHLLRDALFSPQDWGDALHMLPSTRPTFVRSAALFERFGKFVSSPFAGAHVVEATKQVYSAIPARRAVKLAAQLKPILVPAPVAEPRRGHEALSAASRTPRPPASTPSRR